MIRPEGTPGVAFGTSADGDPRSSGEVRESISNGLEIPSDWAWVKQVHGADVIVAEHGGLLGEADAVVSVDPGLPVAVSVADCLPVAVLADGAVAMAHAGWRGAAAGVVESTIDTMTELGHLPHRIVIGPGIGPCCFEVGSEVAARFPNHTATTTWGTVSVDLRGAVRDRAHSTAAAVIDACTHHDERFHSYRRDRTRDRQFGVAWLSPA